LPQQQQQGPCFLVMGIVLLVVGFWWFWPLAVMGGIFFMIGICLISQQSKTTASQTAQQTAQQPVAQPVAQPAPVQIPESHQFCPHCGAQTKGKYCTACGSEID